MKQTINFSQFCDAFRSMDRNKSFSYQGKRALFDFLIGLEEDSGTALELDVIALCCEFVEYPNFKRLKEDYPDIENLEELRDHTTIIEIKDSDGFIIQKF